MVGEERDLEGGVGAAAASAGGHFDALLGSDNSTTSPLAAAEAITAAAAAGAVGDAGGGGGSGIRGAHGSSSSSSSSFGEKSGDESDKALRFHEVRGKGIRFARHRQLAERIEANYCDAIVFSHRPVDVYERVCVRIVKQAALWKGVLRFGFTSVDPNTTRKQQQAASVDNNNNNNGNSEDQDEDKYPFDLPKYVYPDLTNTSGYWADALDDQALAENDTLYFYVNHNGEIHYGINNKVADPTSKLNSSTQHNTTNHFVFVCVCVCVNR